MVHVAVIGATGYAGAQAARLLDAHPEVSQVTRMSGRPDAAPVAADPLGEHWVNPLEVERLGTDFDVVMVGLPHGVGHGIVDSALAGRARVIDLSADHRFADAAAYGAIYGVEHPAPAHCRNAVYGLTEHDRDGVASARLVANPGCYPTAALLPLLPIAAAGLIAHGSRVVVDAKSGVSGAGKSPSPTTLYGNVNENVRAYGVGTHRHAPEIASRLPDPLPLTFVPHLMPMFRGMLATLYVDPLGGASAKDMGEVLTSAYATAPFVHVVDAQPATAHVAGTNHAHIATADAGGAVVLTCAIDNLMKGAAGAAVQNMNVMLGFDEAAGLGSGAGTPAGCAG